VGPGLLSLARLGGNARLPRLVAALGAAVATSVATCLSPRSS